MKRGPKRQLPPFKCPRPNHDQFRDLRHAEKLRAKALKLETLYDLLREHEKLSNPDIDYILGLRKRIRQQQNQLRAMRP